MTLDLEPWLPHGQAFHAYVQGDRNATIVVHDDHGDRDELPVSYFFRSVDEFPETEGIALAHCYGSVLDVGAGAGCHSLVLQQQGFSVCAIEVLPQLVEILCDTGLKDARRAENFDLAGESFDTILLLMNGVGLAGTLAGLDAFLAALAGLLSPGGQILAHSTDLRGDAEEGNVRSDGRYVGEVTFQLEFDGIKGTPFSQVYVDPEMLQTVAVRVGLQSELLAKDEHGGYLAKLSGQAVVKKGQHCI